MDDRSFDRFARALGGASTRRGALAALASLLAGGAALDADAKARKRQRRGGDDAPHSAGKRRNKKRCKPECTGNFSCVKQQCVCETALCGTACCAAGQVCQRGRCVGAGESFCHDLAEACGDGAPCCDGLQCASGQGGGPVACWPEPGGECESDAECAYGHHCAGGACVVDAPPPDGPDESCDPTTCAAAGAGCGSVPDGCDGTLDCGSCPGAQTCGGAGTPNACGCAPITCTGGTQDPDSCACTCPAGDTACDGTCANLQTDDANCGACGDACPNGQSCCGGTCRNLQTDNASCGACGNACTTGRTCANGACVLPATPRHVASFGASGDGASTGQMDGPAGVALDAAGTTAFVTDRTNSRVVVWTKGGSGWSQSAAFGGPLPANGTVAANDGTLDMPTGIAVDGTGTTAWVVDIFNNRIAVWTVSGSTWRHTTTLGTRGSAIGTSQTDGKLQDPQDVAVNAAGTTMAIVDTGNRRVAIWTKSGSAWSHTASFGAHGNATGASGTDGKVQEPLGIAIDAAGTTAWIADTYNHRVAVWTKGSAGWEHVASFGTQGKTGLSQTDGKLDFPSGVAVDPTGTTAWVTDAGNGRIAVWTKNATGRWVHTSSFGTQAAATTSPTDGKLYVPFRTAIHLAGPTALVADMELDRITVWEP